MSVISSHDLFVNFSLSYLFRSSFLKLLHSFFFISDLLGHYSMPIISAALHLSSDYGYLDSGCFNKFVRIFIA